MSPPPRWLRLLPLTLCLTGVAYLALKPSPDAYTIPFIPHAWARFLDRFDAFNNIAAFAIVAAVTHWTLSGWHRERPGVLLRRIAWLEALVIGLELAQLWIPRRFCDWHDMLNGLIGLLIASAFWLKRPAQWGISR